MKYKFSFLTVLASLFILSCTTNPVDELKSELQPVLDKILEDAQTPGVTFSVILPDNQTISMASGMADIEQNIEMKPNDLMFSGSIGKQYCAAMIMKLEEEGKLSINDSLKQYFGEEDWFNRLPNAQFLTLKNLLNHTSGIPRYVFGTDVWQILKDNPEKTWTGVERLSYIFDMDPIHKANNGWGYSDTNYIILGMVIEQVSGENFYDLVENYILKPFELHNTIPSLQRETPGLVAGYTGAAHIFLTPEKVTENGVHVSNPQLEWTGGGFINSTEDLARWQKVYYEAQFLSEKSVEQVITPAPFETDLYEKAGYGFATMIMDVDGYRIVGHSGFFPGYRSIVHYIPELKVALAMQFNKDTFAEGQNIYKLMNRMDKVILNFYQVK